jgi:hypothetical protein
MAKTMKIETIKLNANALFRASVNEYSAQRKAVQFFVSDLLMQHGAYKGFRYLEASDVAPGQSVGLIRATEPNAAHTFPDDSRINFL